MATFVPARILSRGRTHRYYADASVMTGPAASAIELCRGVERATEGHMAEARWGGAERVEIVGETDRLEDPFVALIVRVGGTLEVVRNPRWGDLALRHARHHAEHGFVGAGLRCSIGGACGYVVPYPPDEEVASTVS